jgi:hypothetical protein
LGLHPGLQWLIVEEIEDDFDRSHFSEQHPAWHASMTLLGIENESTVAEITAKGRALRDTSAALPSKDEWKEAAKWVDRARLPRSLIALYEY